MIQAAAYLLNMVSDWSIFVLFDKEKKKPT